MNNWLAPIYQQPVLPWFFGALLAANFAVSTRIRYEMAFRRTSTDLGALTYYQHSGLWLSAWLGVVGATLPGQLLATLGWVAIVGLAAAIAVVRIEGRA